VRSEGQVMSGFLPPASRRHIGRLEQVCNREPAGHPDQGPKAAFQMCTMIAMVMRDDLDR